MTSDNQFSNGFHDARWHKSRQALYSAVLEIATEKPLSKITALDVSERAGLNRSTFYKHAKNASELLRGTLRDELEDIREDTIRDLESGPPRPAIRRASYNVLAHVLARRTIYGPALGTPDDEGLHQLLSDHIERTFTIIFNRGFVTLPFEDDAAATGARFTARFIAHGTVGAIDAWLDGSEVPDITEFLTRFAYLLPVWWPEG